MWRGEHDVLKFEGVLVDVDVVELAVLGDDVPELVDADDVLGHVGVVELVVLGAEVEDDVLAFGDELVSMSTSSS
eukprot:868043-Amphidinium_carterae.2